jgi:uncharacterized membrane protein YgaE (UPF0421/DUF939 family)
MARQSKQTTFKSLGVSRSEAENIRTALALLEETEKQGEKEALRERQRQAAQPDDTDLKRNTRKLVILHKNAEQYPKEEKEFKWNGRYESLRDQLEGVFGVDRVQEQFETDYPKYRVGEDLQHGKLR